MRYVFRIILALACLLMPCWGAESANVLTDADFESSSKAWRTYGMQRYKIVKGTGRNESAALRYEKEADEGAKENSHYDQEVDVEPNTVYVAEAWFKSDGRLRPVLRIASMTWQTMGLAVSEPSDQWQHVRVIVDTGNEKRIRFQIFGGALGERRESVIGVSHCDDVSLRTPTEDELSELRRCRVSIDAQHALRPINPLFFGVNSLFMVEDDASRADGKIEKYLREMPCRLLRYPGGEMADNYHWKTHRLDNPKRWPKIEGPQTMDTDEFMVWCRKIGSEPIFVVNLESGFVHDDIESGVREAADWVRYCNKEKGYNVRYWEIGNETYLKGTLFPMKAQQYGEAFSKFSQAMKAVDPTIKIGAVGPMDIGAVAVIEKDSRGRPWWPTVLEIAGKDMDFAVVHRYYHEGDYSHFAWNPIAVGEPIVRLRELLRAKIPDREIQIALTEWNTWRKSELRGMAHALVIAELIGRYIEGGVDLANFWPLRLPGKGSHFREMLDRETNEPKPPYHVMKLFSSNIGATLVRSWCSNVQVYCCSGLSEDAGQLSVFLVNKSTWKEGMDVEIAIAGFTANQATATVLSAPELMSDDVRPDMGGVHFKQGRWVCNLPPHSLTVVRFRK